MTNSPTPFPQWQPIQYNAGNGQDLLFGGARSQFARRPRPRNIFRVTGRPTQEQGTGRWYVPWQIVLNNFSDGLGKYQGPFELFPSRYSAGYGLDPSFPGYLMLAQLTSTATTPDPTGDVVGLHWENIFDTLIMGAGGGTDVSLIKETSATDPTPVAITYNPTNTSVITSLSQCVLGSADNRLLVGLKGEAPQLIGDASGTVDATLHSDLASLWGHVPTSLPSTATPGASMHLFYAGTSMWNDMDTASATSTNPTATLTNLPQGGYAIKPGEFSLGDGPRRAWFVLPKETNTSGMLLYGTEKLGQVQHFSLDGQEFQQLNFNEMPNGILIAAHGISPVHGSCIVASDGNHVALHNGDVEEDLEIFTEGVFAGGAFGEINSDWYLKVRGISWRNSALYARVEAIYRPGSTNALHFWWKYDWEAKAWNVVSFPGTMVAANSLQGPVGVGGDPVSHATGFGHFYTGANWLRMFFVPPAENPYVLYRFTVGSDSGSGNEYATHGQIATPKWTLPGLEGYPSRIDWMRSLGNLTDHTTAPGNIEIDIAKERADGVVATSLINTALSGSDRRSARIVKNTTNEEWYSLQLVITITRSLTSTRVTPQPLPIVIGGRTYLDVE